MFWDPHNPRSGPALPNPNNLPEQRDDGHALRASRSQAQRRTPGPGGLRAKLVKVLVDEAGDVRLATPVPLPWPWPLFQQRRLAHPRKTPPPKPASR